MKSNNQVSVIIPTYNSERFIRMALESVVTQSYRNMEIILVDDCSHDKTLNIIKEFKNITNIPIKLFKHKKNLGVAYARNKAMELAQGRYVAFLDSDDCWEKYKIEKQLLLLDSTGAALCYTAIDMIDENGERVKGKINVPKQISYKFLLRNTAIATSTVVIDRGKTGFFKMPLQRSGQDYATWLRIIKEYGIAVGVNEVLCHYRRTNDSLSSKKYKSIKQVWDIQTKQESINKSRAVINIVFFVINGIKKYFF